MATLTFVENNDNNKLSRYRGIRYYIDSSGNVVQEPWEIDELEERNDDIFFEVGSDRVFRPDLIANDLYNTPYLYWVVAYSTDMIDPIAESYRGMRFRLPSVSQVYEILGKL